MLRKFLHWLRDSVTTVVAVAGLSVAFFALINGCHEIDQQRDALEAERQTRHQEIDILEQQTRLAGSGLRPVILPADPVIRGYHHFRDGSARMDVTLVNRSSALALRGRLMVMTWERHPPLAGGAPFVLLGLKDPRPHLGGFAVLGGGDHIRLHVTVPPRIIFPCCQLLFLVTYRDVADRLSLTDWFVDVARGRRQATWIQVSTKSR